MTIKIGDLVIVNEFDRPCTRLIAKVMKINGDSFESEYICDDVLNPMCGGSIERATKVEDFGVNVILGSRTVIVIPKDPSIAKYASGNTRNWQPVIGDEVQELREEFRNA